MDLQASRVGEVIGEKYRLVRLLGEGGMGTVYEARHDVIGRRFAVKFLHTELASHPEILARFRREAQAAGSLENENIAAVTDFGTSADGAPYIVMEFLEGQDLAKVLAQTGPLPIQRAAHILIQVCRGLYAAHGRGIVHRDLKPENLLLQTRGDGGDLVKILDFGIAKLKTSERPETATRTGITLGTPYYMPPEQARGQKELDERADIYALGVILFELLSGQKPHNGENYNAILYSILMQAAPRIESYRPDLPPELAAIVHRAMAADAKERHQSVGELSEALAPFTGRSITPPPTTGPGSTVFLPQGPAQQRSTSTRAPVALTPPTPSTYAAPPPPSRTGLWVGLGVALLGVFGATVIFATRGATPLPASAATTPLPAPTPVTPPPASTPVAAPTPEIAPTPAPAVTSSEPPAAAPVTPAPHARGGVKPPKQQAKQPDPPAAAPAPAPAPAAVKPPAPRPKPDDDLFAP